VLHFGCAGETGPAGRPEFVDFTGERNLRSAVRMLYHPPAGAMLERFLRSRPVDVAHLHNVYHHLTASILPVLARHGVGVVMTVHDYRQIGREKLFWRWGLGDPAGGEDDGFTREARRRCTGASGATLRLRWEIERACRWYSRWVDVFCCPTRFLCGLLRDAGTPRGKIEYVPVPVDEIFSIPSAAMPHDAPVVLFVGRLQPEKSPGLMLDLAGRLPNVNVELAGDGPLRETLESRIGCERLVNVRLLGHVPAERMPKLYAAVDAIVVSSRCMENSPVAMLEAMSAGLCPVVPDQPPLREWIADGRTGRRYATGDAEALARVVGETLADAGLRRHMGESARRLVRERHDPARCAEKIETLYETARRRCALR